MGGKRANSYITWVTRLLQIAAACRIQLTQRATASRNLRRFDARVDIHFFAQLSFKMDPTVGSSFCVDYARMRRTSDSKQCLPTTLHPDTEPGPDSLARASVLAALEPFRGKLRPHLCVAPCGPPHTSSRVPSRLQGFQTQLPSRVHQRRREHLAVLIHWSECVLFPCASMPAPPPLFPSHASFYR